MMIFPYKSGSNSVKALSKRLGVKTIKTQNSKFVGADTKLVINWGSTKLTDEVKKCVVINNEEAVKTASNKLTFFNTVKGKVKIPEFTTNKDVVVDWLQEGKTVLARSTLTGHSGQGISIINNEEMGFMSPADFLEMNYPSIPLFVKYINKKEEYRVHVVCGKVIDVRKKAIRKDMNPKFVNFKVRTHHNGFIFMKENVNPNDKVLEQAVLAVEACGLDFGAVDVIWNEFYQEAYVLEVNTAPGLEGETVENYGKAFDIFYHHEKQNELFKGFNKFPENFNTTS